MFGVWVLYEWVNLSDIKLLGIFVFKRSALKAAIKNKKWKTGVMKVPINKLSESDILDTIPSIYPNNI